VDDGCGDDAGTAPGLGEACDGACALGLFCFDPLQVGSAGAPFCTQACCGWEQCQGSDMICWQSAAGGLCRRAEELGVSMGTGRTGDPCSDSSQCRSGLCDSSIQRCTDGCCSSTCGAQGTCRLDREEGFRCAWDPGTAGYGEACVQDSACASGLCLPQGFCSRPCCSSAECAAVSGLGMACRYSGSPGARACVPIPKLGVGLAGSRCVGPEDCRSALCVFGSCTDLCCADSDCGPGNHCLVSELSSQSVLRCEPN